MNIKMPQVLLIPILITAWCICASAQFTPSAKPKPVPTKPGTPCVAYTFIQAQDTGINSICNSITLLWGDLNTSAGGGTVTVVASGSLTSGAFVTGGGGTTLQTPSPGSGLDGSGNATYVGTVTAPSFVGSGTGAGYLELHQGAAPAPGTTAIQIVAPVSVTSYRRTLAGAAASGIPHFANSANVVTETISAIVSADLNITTTTCTNQFVTAISAGGVGTCNSVTLAGAQFANQGTTTTVLHGNASGNPSFALVALGTDVSGTLAAAQFPALTGDITTSAGALATSLKSTGTAGTYRSTTFDAQGRETSGTNPTTFSGYGLSDNSAGLRGTLTDENGSGVALFDSSTSATFITPILGVPTSVTLTNGTGLPVSTGLTGAGTGVLTALGVNVGSVGAPVVNGGALGTPSSGTGTNITGIPAASILAGSLGAGAYVISTSLQSATIELGAATDTTLSRVSAGVVAIEGVNVLTSGATGVQTFLTTPSSANLRSALTDENGSGVALFDSSTSANFNSPVIAGGMTASGSGANTFAGSTGTFLTSTGAVTIGPGAVGLTGIVTETFPVRTSGTASYFTLTPPADTGQTASTESIGLNFVTATRTWADGTVALQRERFFAGPTYNKTTTSATFTDAFNTYFTPPIAGTGVTFTRGHTLGVVDSTSAASSITGAVVVSAAIGTTATSCGIGGGNINCGGNGTFGGTLGVTGHATLEGITSTGATGTGKLVFDTSPTFTTAISAPVGSITSAGYQFAGIGSGAGISLAGGGGLYVIDGGGSSIASISGDIYFRGANSIGFSSSGNAGSTGGDTMFNRVSAGVFGVHTAVGAGFGGGMKMTSLTLPSLASDAATTDSTMCVTTTTGVVTKGSGTLGICLGTSSLRFKKNVAPMSGSLAAVMLLKPITYRYKPGYGDSGAREQVGFGAEDVVKVMPELVGLGTDKKPLSVDILGMVPKLVKAMQEQQAQILSLQKLVAQQRKLIKRTRTRRN